MSDINNLKIFDDKAVEHLEKAIAAYQRYLKLEPNATDRGQIEASIEELGHY